MQFAIGWRVRPRNRQGRCSMFLSDQERKTSAATCFRTPLNSQRPGLRNAPSAGARADEPRRTHRCGMSAPVSPDGSSGGTPPTRRRPDRRAAWSRAGRRAPKAGALVGSVGLERRHDSGSREPTPTSFLDRNDLAPERTQANSDELEVGQPERDADDRQTQQHARDDVNER